MSIGIGFQGQIAADKEVAKVGMVIHFIKGGKGRDEVGEVDIGMTGGQEMVASFPALVRPYIEPGRLTGFEVPTYNYEPTN